MKKVPGLFKIGSNDLIKGAIIALLTVVVAGLVEILNGITAVPPSYPTWATLGHLMVSGLTTGGIYLLKNFLTNSNDQFGKKEVNPNA